jgi:hypothetical protein
VPRIKVSRTPETPLGFSARTLNPGTQHLNAFKMLAELLNTAGDQGFGNHRLRFWFVGHCVNIVQVWQNAKIF